MCVFVHIWLSGFEPTCGVFCLQGLTDTAFVIRFYCVVHFIVHSLGGLL